MRTSGSASACSHTSKLTRFDDAVEEPRSSEHLRSKNRPKRPLSAREELRVANNAKIAAAANAALNKLNEEDREDPMETNPQGIEIEQEENSDDTSDNSVVVEHIHSGPSQGNAGNEDGMSSNGTGNEVISVE